MLCSEFLEPGHCLSDDCLLGRDSQRRHLKLLKLKDGLDSFKRSMAFYEVGREYPKSFPFQPKLASLCLLPLRYVSCRLNWSGIGQAELVRRGGRQQTGLFLFPSPEIVEETKCWLEWRQVICGKGTLLTLDAATKSVDCFLVEKDGSQTINKMAKQYVRHLQVLGEIQSCSFPELKDYEPIELLLIVADTKSYRIHR